MGLFTPKWLKDVDMAEWKLKQAIENEDTKTLFNLAKRCHFADIRTRAIRALHGVWKLQLHEGVEEGGEYLQTLASEAASAHDRCLAAALTGNRALQDQVFRKDLDAANAEQPEVEWLQKISSFPLMEQIYPTADQSGREKILARINDPARLVFYANAETGEALMKEIIRKMGKNHAVLMDTLASTYNKTFIREVLPLLEAKDTPVLDQILLEEGKRELWPLLAATRTRLSGNDDAKILIRLLSDNANRASWQHILRRLPDCLTESDAASLEPFLSDESKRELWQPLLKMLVTVAPQVYSAKYFPRLSNEDKLTAIRRFGLSQKELFAPFIFDTAKKWRVNEPLYYEALHRITEPTQALQLMKGSFGKLTEYELQGYEYLARIAAADQNLLTEFLLESSGSLPTAVLPFIVGHVSDQESLIRLACSSNRDLAKAAIAYVESKNCERVLAQTRVPEVTKEASGKWYAYVLDHPEEAPQSDGKKLLEIYYWSKNNNKDAMVLSAAKQLRGRDALEALKWESNRSVAEALCAGIDDPEALYQFILANDSVNTAVVERFRFFAKADPSLEERFTSFMTKRLCEGRLSCADKLGDYYGLTTPEAEWKFGGTKLIALLTSALQQTSDPSRVMEAVQHLGELYHNVPEAKGLLKSHNGKLISVHNDYPSSYCASEQVNYWSNVHADWQ